MPLQSTVRTYTGFANPGDINRESPWRAGGEKLASTDQTTNKIGRATFYTADASGVATDSTAGTGAFAGIITSSKEYALLGTTSGGPLAPTLILPNNTMAELLLEGECVIELPAAAAIGDVVYANNDGSGFVTTAPGAGVPANTRAIGARVARYPVPAAGLALIHIDSPN